MKTLRYFYYPDHLGSSSVSTPFNNHWITDGSGNAIQHLHYLPFGEDWVDQRNASWNAPYTFSGKEKDVETGYSYFGARYYDSGLSIWLSVDPMSDKYPNLTPYAYCANNPVILVDPDGRDWIESEETGCIEWMDEATSTETTPDGFIYRGTTYAKGSDYELEVYDANKTINTFAVNEHGMVELPADDPTARDGQYTAAGRVIYKYHKRNDVSFNGVVEKDQWGTPENMAVLINLAIAYNTEFSGETLSFGDISTEKGESPRYNSKGTRHSAHKNGSCADLRYPTVRGATSEAGFADVKRTNWLLKAAENAGFSSRIIGTNASSNIKKGYTSRRSDHNNHIHFGR